MQAKLTERDTNTKKLMWYPPETINFIIRRNPATRNDERDREVTKEAAYSIDQNILPVDPGGSGASQKGNGRSDLLRHTKPFGWVETGNKLNLLLSLAISEERRIDGTR